VKIVNKCVKVAYIAFFKIFFEALQYLIIYGKEEIEEWLSSDARSRLNLGVGVVRNFTILEVL
jgi:hypothetical protein